MAGTSGDIVENRFIDSVEARTSAMAQLIYSKDWSTTSLGPIESWPKSLKTLVDALLAMPAPTVVLWGPEYIQLYNDGYMEIAGPKHPTALGQSNLVCWPEAREVVEPIYRKVFYEGQSLQFDEYHIPVARHGKMEDTYFTLTYSPVPDDSGEVGGIFATVFETTAQVHARRDQLIAEKERDRLLRELELQWNRLTDALMESHVFMCILRGPKHVYEMANKSYLQLIGHGRDIIGRPISEALPEVVEQGFVTLLDKIYTTGEPFVGNAVPVELEKNTGHLETVYVDFVYQPMYDVDGKVDGIFVHGVDITPHMRMREEREALLEAERNARQSAESANRLKDEFLATISHELRTPLNAILGWVQLLHMGVSDEKDLQNGLEVIERNARAQVQLVEDLLDMSRIISGKLRLEVQLIDPAEAISAALQSIKPAAMAKKISINQILDSNAGPIMGDPARLQQIVWNLLTNAIKFTPKNGKVKISLQRVDSHVEITVADNGEGVDPEMLPYIFEKFRQGDSSITRKFGGLGLGLSIVKSLIELHGGTIKAESEGKGHGATFTALFPLAIMQKVNTRQPMPVVEDGAPITGLVSLKGIKILAVDDDEDARYLLERVLGECGAEVELASSASEAIDLFRARVPDVLVSDIGLPGTDGYTLLRDIRSMSSAAGGNVPAIAVTAFARSEDRTRALLNGYVAHLSKPVLPAELVATIAAVTAQNRSKQGGI